MSWRLKRSYVVLLILAVMVFLFFGLPNIINEEERQVFNRARRIEKVIEKASEYERKDSIKTVISDFYKTSTLGELMLGEHHRALWSEKVKLPVFKGMDSLTFVKIGGGQQTTSVELKSISKKRYSFRSVNKDNSNALPVFLRASFIRPFIRDQASALNPYSGPVVAELLEALNIQHPTPIIYYLPYNQGSDSTNAVLGGEVVTLAEELHKKWAEDVRFDRPDKILNTDDMFVLKQKGEIEIDRQLYIRCRLFDFLLSDWDRHERQWKWGLYGRIAQPIPIDRDMAFCKFNDGWASKIVRVFNNKFQSFDKNEFNIKGLTRNSLPLDIKILRGYDQRNFLEEVQYIMRKLNSSTVAKAFDAYPPEIHGLIGEDHISTFNHRLERLDMAASDFYELINQN
ncbi:MAG: hypothetical protein AAGF85_15455 [Bacteroidota bacterium]